MVADRVRFLPLTSEVAARAGIDVLDYLAKPHVAWMGVEDAPQSRGWRSIVINGQRKRVLGMGGLVWREGLCWLWLHRVMLERTSAVKVVRSAKAMLLKAQCLGEPRVLATRDAAPRSEKLLSLLGFQKQPDHPELLGKELWVLEWPLSPPSRQLRQVRQL